MKLPYHKLPQLDPRQTSVSVPWIKVYIRASDKARIFLMLIDSGADYCIFDKEVADFLGLDIKSGQSNVTLGLGGKSHVYYFDNIWIGVGGYEVKLRAGFIDGMLAEGRISGVLGRQGFFDYFKVCVDESSKEIELKPKS